MSVLSIAFQKRENTVNFHHMFIASAILALALVHEAAAADSANSYEVTFAEDRSLAHVQATFINPGPTYKMMSSGAEHLAEGWATFVHEFRASDAAGNELTVSGGSGASWIIDAPANETVSIS